MTVETHKETLGFQTEVKQLLKLMINALYSNKDIFLRELISNASDACDKLRFEALTDSGLFEDQTELNIKVQFDKTARTITVSDNGIGMSRQEVIEQIGTIAHSGTREFMERLTGDQAQDAHLIGQFGVGFYSSFIIADRVELFTRRAGLSAEHGVHWESAGDGEFSIETIERAQRGTEIVLHLREGEDEMLDQWRLRSIITRYSDHIGLPVLLEVERPAQDDDSEPTREWEQVNKASALWTRPRKDIKDDEYQALYKHISHDFEDPLAWTHNRVEGNLEYISLLYIPQRAPFDLWDPNRRYGVKLYVRRVFIMDDAEQLMPRYLRFVRGVIDSNDLPLNISREILQNNRTIDSIRAGSVKKVLGLLEDLASKQPEKYTTVWQQFGQVLKEGPGEDYANREQIARLLRFASTHTDSPEQTVSLSDYLSRMAEGQEAIYYLTGDGFASVRHSPHLEIFRKKGVEVLLLSDRVDEWLVSHLHEFEGKPLHSVAKGSLDLDKLGDKAESEPEVQKQHDDEYKDVLSRIKTALGEQVQDVRVSRRLTDSPACLVVDEHAMSGHLERLLREAGQNVPTSKPYLEINPDHSLIRQLKTATDETELQNWAQLLFDQALLAEGGQLEDPGSYVRRLNDLLLRLTLTR